MRRAAGVFEEMGTEAQVPDSCILNDSLEEVISPIIPLIKYSPLNLPANRNAPLGFEEEDHTRVAMTSSPKEIVTESPISSPPPFRRSPKLKIIPFFGRKKTKKQNSVAAKKLTTKSPSSPPPPPPPPPSSSSSQAESSSGDSSLSAEGAKMLGSTSNSLSKPFKPADKTLNGAKYFSSSAEGKSVGDTSTGKMAEKKVKKKDRGLVGLELQLKNVNKTGKITKKMEKIASSCKKESKKDEGTSTKKGAKEAAKKAKLGASKKKDEAATSRRKKKDEEKTSTCTSREDVKDVEGSKKETAISKDEKIEPGKKGEDSKATKEIHVDKSRRRDEEMDSTTSKDEVTENKRRKGEEIDSSIDSCIKKDDKLDTKDQTAIGDECDSKEEPVSTKAKDMNANETLQTESTVEVLVSKANNLGTGGKGKTTKVKVKKLSLKKFQVRGPENGEGDKEEEERQKELEEFLKEEEKLDKKIRRERKRLSQQKSSLNRKKTKKCTVLIRTESIVKSIPAQLSSPSDQSHQSSSPKSFSSEDSLPPTPGNNPPAPSNDDSAPPTQNTSTDSNGIWVQCDNPNCLKWRLLSDIRDPMEIPDKWYCNMNKDSRYSSCDVDEEVWSNLDSNEVYVYSPYVPGSVLLAKLEGYPWWPAMVEADPDTGLYYEAERESGKTSPSTPVRYHVVFFDTPVSRSWIHSLNTATFTRDTTIRNCGPAIPTKYQSGLSVAISQAHGALGLTLNERLSQWGFSHRYGKGRKRRGSTKQEGGKPSKRTKNRPKNEKENVPENEHL